VSAAESACVGLAEFEETDETWKNNGEETEEFLDGSDTEDHWQEEKKFQLEEFQYDQKRDKKFLQFVAS